MSTLHIVFINYVRGSIAVAGVSVHLIKFRIIKYGIKVSGIISYQEYKRFQSLGRILYNIQLPHYHYHYHLPLLLALKLIIITVPSYRSGNIPATSRRLFNKNIMLNKEYFSPETNECKENQQSQRDQNKYYKKYTL